MSTPILVPPGHDIIEEIVKRLTPEERDYSGTLIVFPGIRPGHYVRKKIGSVTGSGYIPPHIMSMDEFVDYIYENELPVTGRKIDSLDAAAILFDIHRSIPTPVGGERFNRVDDFLPLAMNIFKELEEFCIADIHSERLREIFSGYDTGQIGALETYYTKFYNTVAERKYSTRSVRYRETARAIHDIPLKNFTYAIFAGFFVLTKSERDIFQNLIARENTLIIFQDGRGIQEHLNELKIKPEKIEGDSTVPFVRFHKSPDTHGQVFALSELIKNLLEENIVLDENNVIVMPAAETLFPLIQHTLPLIPDYDYNISLGYPAARSTLHGFLTGIMDVILSREDALYYAHDYLRFVLHPYTKNIVLNGSSEPSRILFHAIEDHFSGNPNLSYFEPGDIESDATLFENIEARASGAGYSLSAKDFQEHLIMIHDNTIRAVENASSIGDFAKKLIDIVVFINEHSTARQHPLFNHFSGHLIESLSTLQNSLLSGLSFGESEGYFSFYNHFIEQIQIPFAGTPLIGLQVLGFLETRSLKFDRVFLLDANDDVISGMRSDESLIPTRVRAELGVPTYRDRERLHTYYLDLLIHSAREVDCFYIEKDKKERSRYLEQLAWHAQKSGTTIETDSVQYKIKLTTPEPPEISKNDETISLLKQMKFSATSLDIYLKCPLRFYYRYILKLYERDELTGDIDNLQVGSLVHLILKRYFIPRKGMELTADNLSPEEMNTTVNEVLKDTFGERISGKVHILRRQIEQRMEDFLNAYQMQIVRHSKVKIIDVETPLETEYNGRQLTGKIDRIEKRDESVFILDFKISANANRFRINFNKLDIDNRSTWYNAIGSLQLAVYMLLYENNFQDAPVSLNPVFVLLGKQRLDTNIDIGLLDMMTNPREDMIKIKEIVRMLLDEITDPELDFQPTEDFTAECPNCPYKYICGTQWTGQVQ